MAEFKKPIQEAYGPSSVELIKLDMNNSFHTITIDGKKILLPVLQLKKYYNLAEGYVLVERLHNYPITMVDVLYTYEDILSKFENDEEFRNDFLKNYNREFINSLGGQCLIREPYIDGIKIKFLDALKHSLEDAKEESLFIAEKQVEDTIEIDVPHKNQSEKKDSFWLEMAKDLFGAISGISVKQKNNPRTKKVDCLVSKKIMFMKNGSMIIGGKEVSKYFCRFMTEISGPEVASIKDHISVYINSLNDYSLINSSQYFNRFVDVLFNSNVLEVFCALNERKLPKLSYIGQFNEREGRLEVNRELEKYFDEINSLLIPSRPDGDGR